MSTLSIAETSERLNLSKSHVCKMARHGAFEGAYLVGECAPHWKWHIPAESIEPYESQPYTVKFNDVINDLKLMANTGVPAHEAAQRLGYRSWETLRRSLYNNQYANLVMKFRLNSQAKGLTTEGQVRK